MTIVTIQQVSSARYLDAHEHAGEDYRLVTRPAQHNDSQRWRLTPLGSGLYAIQQLSNDRYMDAHEHAGEDYRLVTRPAQNNASQQWRLTPLGSGLYTVQQVSSGRYMDAHEHAGEDYRLVTRPAQNNSTQQWLITTVAPTDGVALPNVSLWQDLDPHTYPPNEQHRVAEERIGFANLASMQASAMMAHSDGRYYGNPVPHVPIGASPYRSGADIIEALERAYLETGRPISRVHVFGHSDGGAGLYGENHTKQMGLYRSQFRAWRSGTSDPDERLARLVDELPRRNLAVDIVVVLHGCKMASGDDNFARELFAFLFAGSPSLTDARVFAHGHSAACGQNHDWIEFNARNPTGAASSMTPSIYREFTAIENAAADAMNRARISR